jgi:hypothetical protein
MLPTVPEPKAECDAGSLFSSFLGVRTLGVRTLLSYTPVIDLCLFLVINSGVSTHQAVGSVLGPHTGGSSCSILENHKTRGYLAKKSSTTFDELVTVDIVNRQMYRQISQE